MNFILEGPLVKQSTLKGRPIMAGWRHYRCIFNGRGCNTLALASAMNAATAAKNYQAKFFPAGTWEDASREVPDGFMPFPKAEICNEIYGA